MSNMRYFTFEAWDPDSSQKVWAQDSIDTWLLDVSESYFSEHYSRMVREAHSRFKALAPNYRDFQLIRVYEIDFSTGVYIEFEHPRSPPPPPHTPPVQEDPSDAMAALDELIHMSEEMGLYEATDREPYNPGDISSS